MDWRVTQRKVFLIDALGALATAFLIGVVLRTFQSYIGIPSSILVLLSIIAVCYGVYSFTCFILNPKNGNLLLKVVIIANVIYCALSFGLIIYYFQQLTALGLIYFLGELMVIFGLIYFEIKNLSNSTTFP
jgi:hypothetical protein